MGNNIYHQTNLRCTPSTVSKGVLGFTITNLVTPHILLRITVSGKLVKWVWFNVLLLCFEWKPIVVQTYSWNKKSTNLSDPKGLPSFVVKKNQLQNALLVNLKHNLGSCRIPDHSCLRLKKNNNYGNPYGLLIIIHPHLPKIETHYLLFDDCCSVKA